jgi:hypothetical protein
MGCFLCSHFVHADCGFSKFEGGIEVANIGGAKVYTLFSTHIMGREPEVMASFNEATVEKVKANLNNLLLKPRFQEIIENEKRKTKELTDAVKSGNLSWVGIEASKKEMEMGSPIQELVEDYLDAKKLFISQFGDAQKVEDILYLLYNADVIARAKDPSVFQGVKTVPIDNDEAKEKSKILFVEINNIRKDLILLGMNQRLLTVDEFSVIDHLKREAIRDNAMIPQDRIKSELEKLKNEKVKSIANEFLSKVNEFLLLSAKRDETAAQFILNQKGDGIIIMGSAHKAGVIQHLNAACASGDLVRLQ